MPKGLGHLLYYVTGTPQFTRAELRECITEALFEQLEHAKLLIPYRADDWLCDSCEEYHPLLTMNGQLLASCPKSTYSLGKSVLQEETFRWHWQWEQFRQLVCEANLLQPLLQSFCQEFFPIGFNTTHLVGWAAGDDPDFLVRISHLIRRSHPDYHLVLLSQDGLFHKASNTAQLENMNVSLYSITSTLNNRWLINDLQVSSTEENSTEYKIILDKRINEVTLLGKRCSADGRIIKTLQILCSAHGEVVTENDFFNAYYQLSGSNVLASGEQLRTYVFEARQFLSKTLNDSSIAKLIILNRHGVGYYINHEYLPAKIIS